MHHTRPADWAAQRALVHHREEVWRAGPGQHRLAGHPGGDEVVQLGLRHSGGDAANQRACVLGGLQQTGDDQGLIVLHAGGFGFEVDQTAPQLG